MPTGVPRGVRVVAASPYTETGYPEELLKLCAQYKDVEPTRGIIGKKMKGQYPVMYAEFVTMVKSHYAAANLAVPDEATVDSRIKHAMNRCTPSLLAKRKVINSAWKRTDMGKALNLRNTKTPAGKARKLRAKRIMHDT